MTTATKTPATRDRWIALGLLAAVLALAYFALVHAWWTVPMLELQDRIDTLQDRGARSRATLAQASEVRKRLASVREQAARMPGFMDGTVESATSALVARLDEKKPGQTVNLTLLRDGKKTEAQATLQKGSA